MPAASLTLKENAWASVANDRDCLPKAEACLSNAFDENITIFRSTDEYQL